MMEQTVFVLLLRGISEKKQSLSSHLANGNARSYEDYCRIVGEYAAYDQIEVDVKELEKRFIAE
jgi:hypothetical protein